MKSLTLTLSAALFLSHPAGAADGRSWQIGNDGFHIYYSDLDINSASGRARMLKRVERAARRVCDSRLRIEEDECVAATIDRAARGPGGASLALALSERGPLRWARK